MPATDRSSSICRGASARGAACLLVVAVAAPAMVTTAATAMSAMPTVAPARALPGRRRSRNTSRATTSSATIAPSRACPDNGQAIETAAGEDDRRRPGHAGEQCQGGGVGEAEADHDQRERRAVDREALVGGEDQPQRDDDGYGHPGGGQGERGEEAAGRRRAGGGGRLGVGGHRCRLVVPSPPRGQSRQVTPRQSTDPVPLRRSGGEGRRRAARRDSLRPLARG